MSHPEQLGFFRAVAAANPTLLRGAAVIEVGSYDVNGSMRDIFAGAGAYTGVDLRSGPGVDEVGFGHEVAYGDGAFDAAVSGECLEHDPHWPATLHNMIRMTRPGGLVAFSCASTGRPEHGTRRAGAAESPGTQAVGLDYYRNLSEADVRRELPLAASFSQYAFWYLPTSFDLYFAGVRAGDAGTHAVAALPADRDVALLATLMSRAHRLARLPLRGLLVAVPEHRYQDWALPYWKGLLWATRMTGNGFLRAEH